MGHLAPTPSKFDEKFQDQAFNVQADISMLLDEEVSHHVHLLSGEQSWRPMLEAAMLFMIVIKLLSFFLSLLMYLVLLSLFSLLIHLF